MHWGATREKKKDVRLYKREKVNNEPGSWIPDCLVARLVLCSMVVE